MHHLTDRTVHCPRHPQYSTYGRNGVHIYVMAQMGWDLEFLSPKWEHFLVLLTIVLHGKCIDSY